jgi:hypothetical protein
MEQWIIDKYNKGQKIYYAAKKSYLKNAIVLLDYKKIGEIKEKICFYDFLFNPKWEFARVFWGEERWTCPESCLKRNGVCGIGHCGDAGILVCEMVDYEWEYHLQEMVIADDLLKYLEQFKEDKK